MLYTSILNLFTLSAKSFSIGLVQSPYSITRDLEIRFSYKPLLIKASFNLDKPIIALTINNLASFR
jgi:hypothetical protein